MSERPEDASALDRELRVCTVRIDIDGVPVGSGFFVAPGHVLTCWHVLESISLSDPTALDRLEVFDVSREPYTVSAVPDKSEHDDLAILRVGPADKHRCVLLVPGMRMFERAITFGYPTGHREGLARALTSEGTTGDDRLHAFAGGQVQPGMSGSPVLNVRTGGVCGVLSVTRNEHDDLGGYAIPIERFSLLSPRLKYHNSIYHEVYRDWFDALPVDQRSVMLDARPGGAEASRFSRKFVVSVGRAGSDWDVSAKLYPEVDAANHTAEAVAEWADEEEVDLNAVRDKVARLFRDWASRGRADPTELARGRFDPGEEVRLLGGILFGAVLPGEIGEKFESILPQPDHRVELALYFEPGIQTEIAELPWEHLYLLRPGRSTDLHLAIVDDLSFVRVRSPRPAVPEEPHRRQLSGLMVAVAPPESEGQESADRVLRDAQSVAGGLEGWALEPLEMPTPPHLKNAVSAGDFDIVHYVGFGQYTAGADKLALGGVGRYAYEDVQRFAALLSARRPRVVVLQQVPGPRDMVPADLSVFAWDLLDRGVQGVVAYQFPVPAHLSSTFNQTFYQQLVAGSPFEMAVQKARFEMWMAKQDSHAFLSPAAFAQNPGELRLTAAGPASGGLGHVGVN